MLTPSISSPPLAATSLRDTSPVVRCLPTKLTFTIGVTTCLPRLALSRNSIARPCSSSCELERHRGTAAGRRVDGAVQAHGDDSEPLGIQTARMLMID